MANLLWDAVHHVEATAPPGTRIAWLSGDRSRLRRAKHGDIEMRQPCFGACGRSQRRLDDRQERRGRPASALRRREAHAHILILALLDEQLVAVAFRRGLFE